MRIVGATVAAALLTSIAFVACDRNPSSVAQYAYDAGYGMPNPQPGSPISDAGVAPIPAPSKPSPSASPSPGTPSPSPGTPSPSPTNP